MNDAEEMEFEKIYKKLYEQLLICAISTLKDNGLAEEAVQDTFRLAYVKEKEFFRSKNKKTWLFKTLKNVLKNVTKMQNRRKKFMLMYSEQYETLNKSFVEDEISIDLLHDDLLDDEEFQLIKKIIIENKKNIEIADELGISVEACKKRIFRAKKNLKNKV